MDAPSAAAAGGHPNPPLPPPLPEAETTNTVGGDAAPPPPPQTETTGSSTGMPEEMFSVKQLPATSKAPRQEDDVAETTNTAGDVPAKMEGNGKGEESKSGRDEAQEGFGVKPASAATGANEQPLDTKAEGLVRSVIWVLSLRRKDSTPSEKAGAPLPDTGDVAGDGNVPAKEEGNGKDEGSKSGRDEAKALAPPERKETPPRLVDKIKSLIRTESCVSGGGAGVEEGDGTPGSTSSAVKPSPGPGGDSDNRPLKRIRKVFRAILFITTLKSNRKSKDTDVRK
ncbi:hypothetical protein GUJ93_ZPchr0006g46245 [Zizania palustris]|uniref:Uncharacterized protein n=1 Tax=Zizania palustris TaxID=103762 RepID=A0A8J5SZX2_ZIZPA|nr:hypothetical protein GUJ93_ZPchr0006g46245 [Zizania palustris]